MEIIALPTIGNAGAIFLRSGRSPDWLKMKNSDAPAVKHPSLVLKRASASRPSGEWDDDDYDVLADGAVVGRIFNSHAGPVGSQWMWTLAFGHHEDRTPTHGYAATREAAMAAFAKSWPAGVKKSPGRAGASGSP